MQKRNAVLFLTSAATLAVLSINYIGTPAVEAKLIQQRRKPVQRLNEPKVGCAATGGAPKHPFLDAAYYGDIPALEKMLAKGTDVNVKNGYGTTALLVATNHARTEVVKFLLEKGADPNINNAGHTPLFYAACLADLQSVKALLEKGADVNANNSIALVSAIRSVPDRVLENEREQIFRLFLDKGVKVPAQAIIAAADGKNLAILNELLSRNSDVKAKNADGNTALHVACESGTAEIVKALIDKGADVNEKNGDGETPLMIAAEGNRLAIIEVLLNNGADVNVKDGDNETALDYATDKTIILLLNQAKSGKKSGSTYAADDVHSLVLKGDVAKLKELLKKDPSAINAKDSSGATPLHYAAKMHNKESVAILLANKADVNAKDNDGKTPLHYAAWGSETPVDVIQILLENGADPNAESHGETPFHIAVAFYRMDVVKLMLDYKADVKIKYRGETSVLKIAQSHPEIMKLLLDHGAK